MTAHEIKKWHNQISDYVDMYGPVVGDSGCIVQFHHPKGRKYKHNKTHIGEQWCYPIPWEYHDVSSEHPLNVTHHRKTFIERFGPESKLWHKMICGMVNVGWKLPFGNEVEFAIMDTGY